METKDYRVLYGEKEARIMKVAEESRLPGRNRVEEIRNFARMAGIRKIGIASCIGLQKEASKLKSFLEPEFEVFMADCKIGRLASSEFSEGSKGISCNPAGQAEYLSEQNTGLNISFGLCLGHDIIFNMKSRAPVTTLIVKDRQYKHNPYRFFEETGLY